MYLTWFLQVKLKIEAAMGLHTRQMRSIDWLAQFRPPSGLPAAVIVHSSECYCPGNCFAQWSISFSVHVCSVWRAAWRHRFLSLAISAAAAPNKPTSPRGFASHCAWYTSNQQDGNGLLGPPASISFAMYDV